MESHKIRAEERTAARAELERILGEQRGFYASQQSSLRAREAAAAENMRKREAEFEASCYEHRQKMLAELDALRTREKKLMAEVEVMRSS